MSRAVTTPRKVLNTAIAWGVALLVAFPIIWTLLTSFKPEPIAVKFPPVWFDFDWSLKNYTDVQRQRAYFGYFVNSVVLALGSTALGPSLPSPPPGRWPLFPAAAPATS
jgi:sorbitol/mannitol transport system permease protein